MLFPLSAAALGCNRTLLAAITCWDLCSLHHFLLVSLTLAAKFSFERKMQTSLGTSPKIKQAQETEGAWLYKVNWRKTLENVSIMAVVKRKRSFEFSYSKQISKLPASLLWISVDQQSISAWDLQHSQLLLQGWEGQVHILYNQVVRPVKREKENLQLTHFFSKKNTFSLH